MTDYIDYKQLCAEMVDAWASGKQLASVIVRARALLDQPVAEGPTDEDILQELIDVADDAMMSDYPGDVAGAGRRLLARYGRPTPQPPATAEVAASLIELRSTAMGLGQMGMHVAAKRVERAADLLERLASDSAGLTAAADSLWADNISLLSN